MEKTGSSATNHRNHRLVVSLNRQIGLPPFQVLKLLRSLLRALRIAGNTLQRRGQCLSHRTEHYS